MTLVSLVIFLLVAILVLYVTKWFLTTANVPDPPARVVLVVVGLLLLFIFLQRIGLLSGSGPLIRV